MLSGAHLSVLCCTAPRRPVAARWCHSLVARQVLHCLAQAASSSGGESLLVDGVAAAEALQMADRDAFGAFGACVRALARECDARTHTIARAPAGGRTNHARVHQGGAARREARRGSSTREYAIATAVSESADCTQRRCARCRRRSRRSTRTGRIPCTSPTGGRTSNAHTRAR